MNLSEKRRVLAVGIDAAEPTLVRQLIERGELPALKKMLDDGTWSRVASPSDIGSGAVWPTFMTGTDPARHGIYGEWCWQPETMSLTRINTKRLTPFWEKLNRRGATVGVLDVPFAPAIGFTRGFEISEWGAHDVMEGRTQVYPAALSETLLKQAGAHPFSSGGGDTASAQDRAAQARLGEACLSGVRLRGEMAARLLTETQPDLSIIIFPELHSASHHLWHTLVPEHPFYAHRAGGEADAATLHDILRGIDAQIARLVELAGAQARVVVFSLHGMQPARGVPTVLDALLSAWGFARRADWRTQTWPERARSLFAAAKRRTPASLKRLYYGTMSRTLTHRLAQTTMLPTYDWPRTRAFSLPSDQHGWVRLNVAGRESSGIVAPGEYDETCRRLTRLLRASATADGRPLVRDVIQPSSVAGEADTHLLPDLVVHWDDAAFDNPLRLDNPSTESYPMALKYTGRHALDGFCLMRGEANGHAAPAVSLAARDLHLLLTEPLDM